MQGPKKRGSWITGGVSTAGSNDRQQSNGSAHALAPAFFAFFCPQECLEDPAPQVQALGLRCVALLCEADSLDFYAAWRFVQARFPALPAHPGAAAAWVSSPRLALLRPSFIVTFLAWLFGTSVQPLCPSRGQPAPCLPLPCTTARAATHCSAALPTQHDSCVVYLD